MYVFHLHDPSLGTTVFVTKALALFTLAGRTITPLANTWTAPFLSLAHWHISTRAGWTTATVN